MGHKCRMESEMSRKFEIYGKTRIIREIYVDEPDVFSADYKMHSIRVEKEEDGWIYVRCSAPDGCRIVDGYVAPEKSWEDATIEDGIRECLENIFYEEK